MRKVFLFCIFLLLFFAGGFILARTSFRVPGALGKPTLSQEPSHFVPTLFPTEQHLFVIVIVGRNNGALVENTLRSAFSQKYENFRILYIDDASDDGSFELTRDLIYESGLQAQVHLVHNETILGPVANVFRAVQSCENNEIVVLLGGEDRLAHEWVLQRLNQYYADPDLWLTVGQSLEYPSFKRGLDLISLENQWRQEGFRNTLYPALYLKTFYAALFHHLRASDATGSEESAYMIPLLEMAKDHFQCTDEVLYLSLSSSSIDRERPMALAAHMRDQTPYAPLTTLFAPPLDPAEGEDPL